MTNDDRSPSISKEAMDEAWSYARGYYENVDHYELLARYRPEVVHGYMTLRQAAFNTGEGAALSERYKELAILAIEIGRCKTNPPPVGHARKAIDAGATPSEVAEIVSLCIMIGGMLTYREAGRFALQEAEEHYARRKETAP